VLLPGLFSLPIIDRDAPHFAQATRQMVETGNYWQINFQDKPRHLKPPGIYWLQAGFVKAFSTTQSHKAWPYRMPSVLGGLLSILFLFFFTRKFYSDKVAIFAAIFLGSSLLLIIESHLVVTDAVLLLTMILMQGALWQIYVKGRNQEPIHFSLIALFWLAMGAGILIKGITPLVGFLTMFGLCVFDRNFAIFRYSRFGLGLILLVLSLSWLIPVSIAGHSNFLWDMIHKDVAPKLAGGQESHGMPPGYFMIIFSLMFWSGALFIWRGYQWGWQQRKNPVERFLWAWIIPSWIFFAIVPTKLPEYVLPVYPAIAILIAKAVVDSKQLQWNKFFLYLNRFQYGVFVLYGLILAGLLLYVPYFINKQFSYIALFSASVIILSMVFALCNVYFEQIKRAALFTIFGSAIAFFPVWQVLLPSLKPLWVSKNVATVVHHFGELTNSSPLLSVGYSEPSLVFMTDTHHVKFVNACIAIDLLKKQNQEFVLVDKHHRQQLISLAKKNHINLKPLQTITGYNFSDGKWVQLTLYNHEK